MVKALCARWLAATAEKSPCLPARLSTLLGDSLKSSRLARPVGLPGERVTQLLPLLLCESSQQDYNETRTESR